MTTLAWIHIDFMQKALLGSVLVSLGCGILGIFVFLRRIIFISMAMAEVSTASVALAFFFGLNPTVTAFAITLGCIGILAYIQSRPKRFPPEALIALVYMLASSAAVLLIAKNPAGETELLNVMFGNILTVHSEDLIKVGITSGLTFATVMFFFRCFLFVSFDPEMAAISGMKASLWHSIFYILLGVMIVVGIQLSGALLTFSYLILPAYVGLKLSKSLKGAVAWSLTLGPIATFFGLWLSFVYDLPSGPSITAVLGVCALLSSLRRS